MKKATDVSYMRGMSSLQRNVYWYVLLYKCVYAVYKLALKYSLEMFQCSLCVCVVSTR